MPCLEYIRRTAAGRELVFRSLPTDDAVTLDMVTAELRRDGYFVRVVDGGEAPLQAVCTTPSTHVDDPCKACGRARHDHFVQPPPGVSYKTRQGKGPLLKRRASKARKARRK